jgi:hypothetical protein
MLNKLQPYFSGVPIKSVPFIDQRTTSFDTNQAAVIRATVCLHFRILRAEVFVVGSRVNQSV